MAPMKQKSNYGSSNYGEGVVPNVLATCYIVDTVGSLKGLHYCSTWGNGLPSPPSSPPLVAITPSNELAVLPKDRARVRGREIPCAGAKQQGGRRGGATHLIREECVRFFCETMRAVFWVEKDAGTSGSCLMGADSLPTPPDDRCMPDLGGIHSAGGGGCGDGAAVEISAWAEVWDYVGGTSYRAFVGEQNGEKTLFAFFDSTVVDMELKQALMALIELAESPIECARLVICIDRDIPRAHAQGLMKSLRWVGFEPATLDHWADGVDVTSDKWLFMGMEV